MTTTDNEAVPFMIHDGPQMVSFGPEAHQSVHLETAERMLTMLAGRNPKLFRELYGAAVLGER